MAEDFDNYRWILDRGDDLQAAAAVRAVLDVDVEDPFEQPGPTQARRRALRVIACGRGCLLQDIEEGRFARGASTITQQVVKNVYLSQEKTITRKIREMIWARALNKTLTKREILTFYVNLVEFGPGLYGVRDAARVYFGKSPAELSPKEAAFLVMLLPSPRRYSVSYRQKHLTPYARRRVSQILLIMHKMGVLDEGAYASARAEALWGVDAGVDAVSDKDIEKALDDGEDESVADSVTRAGDAASGVDRVAAHRCDSPHR
jgi:membrane peptidoglycan carboxypeptidase